MLLSKIHLPFASRSPQTRWLLRLLLFAFVVAFGFFISEVLRVTALTNRHTVLEGRIYRCSQQSASQLRELVQSKQIRTVMNLRGVSPGFAWYTEETKVCHELGINQEDITLSANRLPPPSELRRLIEVLDQTEYPVLVHCKQGADRTGLVSAIAVLLYTPHGLDEARKQLWPVRGHFRFGRTAAMDEFFDYYEAWLNKQNVPHGPERFRQWARYAYTPGPAKSQLKWLDPVPVTLKTGQPLKLRLEARNSSSESWELQPGNYSGIHLGYRLASPDLQEVYVGQAGLMRRSVGPGESITFDVVIPPQRTPGKYVLIAEMHDSRGASVPIRRTSFVQLGDDSLMAEIIVE